jgi:hypothetical protein
MNYLFTHAPLFVPGMSKKDWQSSELEHRVAEVKVKQGSISHDEVKV